LCEVINQQPPAFKITAKNTVGAEIKNSMNNKSAGFCNSKSSWKEVLQNIAAENNSLKTKVNKVLEIRNDQLQGVLQQFNKRFDSQDQLIRLLHIQLDELNKKYVDIESLGKQASSEFEEQVENFKMDIDRAALLFAQLKQQFCKYVVEHLN
jgi:hypothetical protein